MSDNEEAEQEVKAIIYRVLHDKWDVDANSAGEVTNDIYENIWEYIKDYD
jgi:hypothetical protein